MARRMLAIIGVAAVAAAGAAYLYWRPASTQPLVGLVRATEIRVAPEVGGLLASIKVKKGDRVRRGDIVAELSALELTAQVGQARAALGAAAANRDHVYAGVRAEEIAALAAEISKAKSRLDLARTQQGRIAVLARDEFASVQARDQVEYDTAAARADIAEAQADYDAAQAGPTKEERAIADATVSAAAAALAVLERRLDKTILRAPADGIVSVVIAEIGENTRAGQPILAIAEFGKEWLSFNVREDMLHGLTVGTRAEVTRADGGASVPAIATEVMPLGAFATWQAERAIGDHDRNTLRLRLDPQGNPTGFEPGMTAWLRR